MTPQRGFHDTEQTTWRNTRNKIFVGIFLGNSLKRAYMQLWMFNSVMFVLESSTIWMQLSHEFPSQPPVSSTSSHTHLSRHQPNMMVWLWYINVKSRAGESGGGQPPPNDIYNWDVHHISQPPRRCSRLSNIIVKSGAGESGGGQPPPKDAYNLLLLLLVLLLQKTLLPLVLKLVLSFSVALKWPSPANTCTRPVYQNAEHTQE